MEFSHSPVLLRECIEGLNIRPDGIYIDGTFGRAGHSLKIAAKLEKGKLLCIDRDETAINEGQSKLSEYKDRVIFSRGDFRDTAEILKQNAIEKIDGILLDLGVSSPQLDDKSRGFSYMNDAPLDMRMDRNSALTAFDIVNTWTYEELKRILFAYGEERFAPLIAKAIVKGREEKPVVSTFELVEIIKSSMPAAALREKQHPAKRSFQALRIAVNDELTAVEKVLSDIVPYLNPLGRIAVISFHSLEDRMVKTMFSQMAKGCTCPPRFPVCVCGGKPVIKIINKKPITPEEKELEENPRSRSAKLRIAEKSDF